MNVFLLQNNKPKNQIEPSPIAFHATNTNKEIRKYHISPTFLSIKIDQRETLTSQGSNRMIVKKN